MSKQSNITELHDLAVRHNTAEREFFRVKNEHEQQMKELQAEFAPRIEAYNRVVSKTAAKFGYNMSHETYEALHIPNDATFVGIRGTQYNEEVIVHVQFTTPEKDKRTGLLNGKTQRFELNMNLLIGDPIAVAQHTRKFIRGLQGKQAVQEEKTAKEAYTQAQKILEGAEKALQAAQQRTNKAEQRVLQRAQRRAKSRA